VSERFFVGYKELSKSNKIPLKDHDYCYIQYGKLWKLKHSASVRCGETITDKYTKISGLSKSKYKETTEGLSATLDVGVASLSANLSEKLGESISFQEQTSTEIEKEIQAPPDGIVILKIFQLITIISVDEFRLKGRIRPSFEETKKRFTVDEDHFHIDVVEQDDPSCGSIQSILEPYNGFVRVEFDNATLTKPCKVSKDELFLSGSKMSASRYAKGITAALLPSKTRKLLGLKPKETGKISYSITHPEKIMHKPPTIVGLMNKPTKYSSGFNIWLKRMSPDKSAKIWKEIRNQKSLFNQVNWSLYLSNYYGVKNMPSKSSVHDWLEKGRINPPNKK